MWFKLYQIHGDERNFFTFHSNNDWETFYLFLFWVPKLLFFIGWIDFHSFRTTKSFSQVNVYSLLNIYMDVYHEKWPLSFDLSSITFYRSDYYSFEIVHYHLRSHVIPNIVERKTWRHCFRFKYFNVFLFHAYVSMKLK